MSLWHDLILRKRFLRSDNIWTRSLPYKLAWMRNIPFSWDTNALMVSQYWNRDKIARYQDERIARVIRSARQLPLWKRSFEASGLSDAVYDRDSLLKIPVSDKKTFIDISESEYVDTRFLSTSTKDQTSGSTGRPFSFYHNTGYVLRSYAISERIQRTASGGSRLPLIIIRRGGRPGFAFKNFDFFYLESYSALKNRLDALLALMRKRGRVVLFLWGSVATELARLLVERDEHPDIGGLLVTGEAISTQDRAAVERATGARVTVYYAGSEVGRLAFECETGKLHINDEWAYMEIVDTNGARMPSGTFGRIVVTLFENDVMPLIRYDNGDEGAISDTPCECGRGLRTLELRGRQIHVLRFADGRAVSVLDIKARFDRLSGVVDQYQIVRTGPLAFTMRVVAGKKFDESKDELTDMFVRLIHPEARISWDVVASIEPLPSGKAAYFIDSFAPHA